MESNNHSYQIQLQLDNIAYKLPDSSIDVLFEGNGRKQYHSQDYII
jgi:hypothetical protein